MKYLKYFAIAASVAITLSSCDANRELRDRVEELAAETKAHRASCNQARDRESSERQRHRDLIAELSELQADKEWDGIARSGDAGTQELLIQAKRTMNDPGYESTREDDIERIKLKLKGHEQDDIKLQEKTKATCDALLQSNEMYLQAKKALDQALKQQR